ncbi:glycosyltransferase [Leucobacter chromiiresistens]|uniref:Glycosyltransferase involved in cell wall bisynthesis n=1 Tax=Leucobacter chromiiresistens TaxID=1079994 RepID=A0A1H0ZBU2_9MICO|nr:glycosyltransferase [Leucobacter chromiiresistens]SDQ24852.1 Glycosyltransferase involved in cell wall bisynthesis [Leucobacter chromiiresistens]
MKIAMVSEHANPLATPGSVDAGGQNVHVAALSRALAERGHRVTVYTRRDDPSTRTRVTLCPGVEVVHLTAGPEQHVPKDELLPHLPALAEGLAAAWRFDRPDVVHSHFWMSGIAALDAAEARGTGHPPVLHTFHALGSVKRRFQGAADTSPPERERLEPLVGQRVDTVIATCPDEVEELHALGIPAERIDIAPCGVDLEMFEHADRPPRRAGAFRVLSLGRLVPRKGVDIAIRALGVLREQGIADVELHIVGTGDAPTGAVGPDAETRRLADLAESLGVADQVRFLGRVPRDDVPALIRAADAVVCTPWYEPFGIVPLESMACGTPVVAANVGGLGDTVVHEGTGLLVPPQDPEAVAEAFARLRADPAFAAALGAAGRTRVEHRYSWERVAARTELIYARTLRERAQHHSQQITTRIDSATGAHLAEAAL